MNPTVSEAERQLLIALIELTEPLETPNNTHYTFHPKTLEQAAAYFLHLRVDWQPAVESLPARGLITNDGGELGLTRAGAAVARQERLDHPPIWYWYREFYTLTDSSPAYSRFCAELYGRDLCQTDFSDMEQIDFLIETANLAQGAYAHHPARVLDLGCGSGKFAEYLSDCTGAQVWGVDYTPEAIEQALARTTDKRERLDFRVGNLDHLDFPPGAFDLLVSIDTLYMPNDLTATLRTMRRLLAPRGRMLIFYISMLFDPSQPRETLLPDRTPLAQALDQVGMSYTTWDFSEKTFHLMRRKRRLAESMRAEFEAEGTQFLYNHLITESDGSTHVYDPRTATISRYLYDVQGL